MSADIVRISTAMPVPPGAVNAFLVPLDDGGWVLVDGGMNSEEAWAALDAGVRANASWAEIRLHIATHMHQDHVGLNGRVREASNAPLAMGALDAQRMAHAARYPDEEASYREKLLREAGVPAEVTPQVGAMTSAKPDRDPIVLPDHQISCTHGAHPIPLASEWVALWTPGHTAGHVALYRSRDATLISGDAVLPDIDPTIGVNRQRSDPVSDQLETLARLSALNPKRVLGGHGDPLFSPHRIVEMRATLLHRVQETLDSVENGDTAWGINSRLHAPRRLRTASLIHELRGTLAALEWLRIRGRLSVGEAGGGVRTYGVEEAAHPA